MASIRLIAQYPNVGNSGHIFFVPMGQKENYLGVGEKINTQMLSIRHGKIGSSDNNNDGLLDSSLFQGNDFLAVSIPAKQVLKDKSSDRVSHVWIALEGLDVASNESLIAKLYTELGLLIPKLEVFVLSLGHLDPNAARYIEVQEMAEWAQNPIFSSITCLWKPKKKDSLLKWQHAKKVVSNLPPWMIGFPIMIVAIVCAFFFFFIQSKDINTPPGNGFVSKSDNFVSGNFLEEFEKIHGKISKSEVDKASKIFGISKKQIFSYKKNEVQPTDKTKKYINLKDTIKLSKLIGNKTGKTEISLYGDHEIMATMSRKNISKDDKENALKLTKQINEFSEELKSLNENKLIYELINNENWTVSDDFIRLFINESVVPILKNKEKKPDRAFGSFEDVLKRGSELSSEFDRLFSIALHFSDIDSKFGTFSELNERFKACLIELNKP
jgi:hypothetical protein